MIRSEQLGDLQHIVLDRPEKLNALTRGMIEELRRAVGEAAEAPDIRGIVISGQGGSFCAGVDLHEFAGATPDSARAFITALKDLCAAVRGCVKPVACAIQGHCLGGGLELVAVADFRVADPDAELGMPEVVVGLPSVIDAAILERHLGVSRARELILTGDPVSGRRAFDWGFVNALAPPDELVGGAALLVRRVTRHHEATIAAQKRLFRDWLNLPYEEAVEASVEELVEAFARGLPQSESRKRLERRS